jgi:hypothetical protein
LLGHHEWSLPETNELLFLTDTLRRADVADAHAAGL